MPYDKERRGWSDDTRRIGTNSPCYPAIAPGDALILTRVSRFMLWAGWLPSDFIFQRRTVPCSTRRRMNSLHEPREAGPAHRQCQSLQFIKGSSRPKRNNLNRSYLIHQFAGPFSKLSPVCRLSPSPTMVLASVSFPYRRIVGHPLKLWIVSPNKPQTASMGILWSHPCEKLPQPPNRDDVHATFDNAIPFSRLDNPAVCGFGPSTSMMDA